MQFKFSECGLVTNHNLMEKLLFPPVNEVTLFFFSLADIVKSLVGFHEMRSSFLEAFHILSKTIIVILFLFYVAASETSLLMSEVFCWDFHT